ncbi:MAG: hypothetical protein GVY18_17335 [Bacteroidetes bacterium]|jgi:hypothetical protein|nr:hypothetical protein [Bacteroidota bacterium]
MYDVRAQAIRSEGIIEVTVTGKLPDSCHQAEIADKYPGGNIFYIVDPGEAQVFIKESRVTDAVFCSMVLVPWIGHVNIVDDEHDVVSIYVNERRVLTVDVEEEPEEYIVIQPIDGNGVGCSIIPATNVYIQIYKQVYGPASRDECEQWVAKNCQALSSIR